MPVKVSQEARYTLSGKSAEIRGGHLAQLLGEAENSGWDPDEGKVTVTVDKGVVTVVMEYEEKVID
jgi:hypothetical protein